jgi:hypothetical protein
MVQMRAQEPLHALPGCDAVTAHRTLLPLPFFARSNYPGIKSLDGRSGRWRLALQKHSFSGVGTAEEGGKSIWGRVVELAVAGNRAVARERKCLPPQDGPDVP